MSELEVQEKKKKEKPVEDKYSLFQKKLTKLNNDWNKSNKTTGKRIRLGSEVPKATIVSTGNSALDWGLSGGYPEGVIIELSGNAQVGKTTTTAYMMKAVQDMGKLVIWYNTEEHLKPEKAWGLAGVDESKVIYLDARNSGEDGINVIRDILFDENGEPTDIVGMIVIDSLASLAPQAEVTSVEDKGMESMTIGRHAAMGSKIFRQMCGNGWLRAGCTLVVINQQRTDINSYGGGVTTTGGKATQYYPKIRIELSAVNSELVKDSKGEIIGHTVRYKVKKNNSGSGYPYRTGSWVVIYGQGIDVLGPIIQEALSYGIITEPTKSRFVISYYDVEEQRKETDKLFGRTNLIKFLENPDNEQILSSVQDIISRIRIYSNRFPDLEFVDGQALLNGKPEDIFRLIEEAGEELEPEGTE